MVRGQPQRASFCGSRIFRNLDARHGANRSARMDSARWRAVALEWLAIGVCPELSGRKSSRDMDFHAATHTYRRELSRRCKTLSAAGQSAVERQPLSRVESRTDT